MFHWLVEAISPPIRGKKFGFGIDVFGCCDAHSISTVSFASLKFDIAKIRWTVVDESGDSPEASAINVRGVVEMEAVRRSPVTETLS